MGHVTRLLSLSILLLPFAIVVPATQAVTIDAFTDSYPPNPDLPVSGREMIYVGTTCDGSACPPGAIINHTPTDQSSQSGLPGVLGGERDAVITQTASSTQSLINDGVYLFPFVDFAGVEFTDVDKISYFFDASAHTSVDYALGPFRTNEPPVQVNQTTWGRTKAIYR